MNQVDNRRVTLEWKIHQARLHVDSMARTLYGQVAGGNGHLAYESAVGRLQELEQDLREYRQRDNDFDRARRWTRDEINHVYGISPLQQAMHNIGARRIHHPSPVAVWNA